MKITAFQVNGAKEMNDLLKKLPQAVGRRVMVNALRAGARIIVAEAKRRVPVKTGRLRDSIVVKTIRNVTFTKGKGLKTAGRSRVVVGFVQPGAWRAHLTEFGTSKAAAKPFFRPAIDETQSAVLDAVGKTLGKGIEREAKKLAGPLAKSGLLKRRRR